jgi:hypothetical protein
VAASTLSIEDRAKKFQKSRALSDLEVKKFENVFFEIFRFCRFLAKIACFLPSL